MLNDAERQLRKAHPDLRAGRNYGWYVRRRRRWISL